jgi:hypothetical protein
MPFISGQPLTGDEHKIPWVLDNTYSELNIGQIPEIRYTSPNRYSADIIDQAQIHSMLFLLNYYNPNFKRFPIEHRKLMYTQSTINEYATNNELPSIFNPDHFVLEYTENEPGLVIFENTKNSTTFFPVMDKLKKDEKMLSMGLQHSVTHRVRVYKETNCYIILTNTWTWTMTRKIIALMPKLFPQLQLPEEAMQLFYLFGTEDYDAWTAAYIKWIQNTNILESIRQKALIKAFSSRRSTKIIQLNNSIKQYRNNIETYLTEIRKFYENIETFQAQLIGFESAKEDYAKDIINYMSKNKAIISYKAQENCLYLLIRTPWCYFDQTMFNKIYQNPHSAINYYPNIAKVLSKIFTPKPMFEFWTDTSIIINLNDNSFSRNNTDNCILFPQSHIHEFNCWGNNKGYIQKALSEQDYIGGIEQMIAACKNLNWYDNPVVTHFIDKLNGSYKDIPTIKDLKTGEFISCRQALTLIKESEQNEINQNNPGTETVNTPETQPIIG